MVRVKRHWRDGYTREDGTYVEGHWVSEHERDIGKKSKSSGIKNKPETRKELVDITKEIQNHNDVLDEINSEINQIKRELKHSFLSDIERKRKRNRLMELNQQRSYHNDKLKELHDPYS